MTSSIDHSDISKSTPPVLTPQQTLERYTIFCAADTSRKENAEVPAIIRALGPHWKGAINQNSRRSLVLQARLTDVREISVTITKAGIISEIDLVLYPAEDFRPEYTTSAEPGGRREHVRLSRNREGVFGFGDKNPMPGSDEWTDWIVRHIRAANAEITDLMSASYDLRQAKKALDGVAAQRVALEKELGELVEREDWEAVRVDLLTAEVNRLEAVE